MANTAYLVVGPESSGTRLLTRLLMAAGCEGDGGHWQQFDTAIPAADGRDLVWRRSVPYAGDWPDLRLCARLLGEQGYRVRVIVTLRDMQAMERSQVAAGHVPDIDAARARIQCAIPTIFRALGEPDAVVIYDALVQHPHQTLIWLMAQLDLPVPEIEPIFDGNAKWYEVEAIHD